MPDLHEQAAARRQAITDCAACDEAGWTLGADGLPLDPARRCDHTDRPDDRRFPE